MPKSKAKNTAHHLGVIEKLYLAVLLVIFGGIVLHAPLSVGISALLPDYALLAKSWKEILILVATVLALAVLYRKGQLNILKEPLLIGIGVYIALHIVSVVAFYQGAAASAAGLAIDLRYLLFFALVYIYMRLYPEYRRLFIKVVVAGAFIVGTFAILQVTLLPYDFLKYLGYSKDTIIPYLVIDQNYDFVRINSTLRGPNPLGAYATIVLSAIVAWFVTVRKPITKNKLLAVAILLIGSGTALWASYSRSALVAAAVAVCVVLVLTFARKLSFKMWAGVVAVLLIVAIGVVATRGSGFLSNVLLHDNPTSVVETTSNEGHIESLVEGTQRLFVQPFGAGVGSTGSASFLGDTPFVLENQYLFVAHEVGWLGLIVFLLLFAGVMNRLWAGRKDWLALGVFASGIGLFLIGLLLPVWVDDTVAIIWWGLAAVAIGSRGKYE